MDILKFDPYKKIKEHDEVKLTYTTHLGDGIIGVYIQTTEDTFRIYLNNDIHFEQQDEALYILMKHHNTARGETKVITIDNMRLLNWIKEDARRFEKMAADVFLKGSLFVKRLRKTV
ncbi:hypothetical protein [Paenibacillus sedimenti]|uniref:Uncharacterized protein n=1 Tax=Paenibacillus sedimenti TaxID=2770274 RepID=A0A926QK96_9BACL|nr:hypothetical protein [Paenibacillus sedimenti]MBD0381252.1 hypothetical protein [Paenibacillus sedimenti]